MKDLLDRRRTLHRKDRRRQGHTEFRRDDDLEGKESKGNNTQKLETNKSKKKGLKELVKDWDQECEKDETSPKHEKSSPKRA